MNPSVTCRCSELIPYEYAELVLEKVLSILKEEEHMRDLIFSKAPLDELRPLYRQRYKK